MQNERRRQRLSIFTLFLLIVLLSGNASAAQPSDEEQYMLELINRMRADPVGELGRLVNLDTSDPANVVWLSPRSDIPGVHGFYDGLNYINLRHVDPQLLYDQFQTLVPAPPLAWDEKLADAAAFQAGELIGPPVWPGNVNPHEWGSVPLLPDRIDNALYNDDGSGNPTGYDFFPGWGGIRENIFAAALSIEQSHAGFAVDWSGVAASGGIQDPPGHRIAFMDPAMRDFGAALLETTPSAFLGPKVVDQVFARPLGTSPTTPDYSPLLTGVVFMDMDGDLFYSPGEGIGDIDVEVFDGASPIASTATWASGGFSLAVPDGTFDVVIHGPGGDTLFPSVSFSPGNNVKIDLIAGAVSDTDSDGVADDVDNCILVKNGPNAGPDNQLDSDGDNYGDVCDADLDNNGLADSGDLDIIAGEFGEGECPPSACFGDLDGDDDVDGIDLGIFVHIGIGTLGPSGLMPM